MSKFDYDIFYGGTDDLGVSKEKYTKETQVGSNRAIQQKTW